MWRLVQGRDRLLVARFRQTKLRSTSLDAFSMVCWALCGGEGSTEWESGRLLCYPVTYATRSHAVTLRRPRSIQSLTT